MQSCRLAALFVSLGLVFVTANLSAQPGQAATPRDQGAAGHYSLAAKSLAAGNMSGYRRSLTAAAEAGHSHAMVQLGLRHMRGEAGFPVDLKTALAWFKRAAGNGSPYGLWFQAVSTHLLREQGADPGGETPEEMELRAAKMAIQSSRTKSPDVLITLALAYRAGTGVQQDSEAEVRYLTQAAEAGDVDAQTDLGRQYTDEGNLPSRVNNYHPQRGVSWLRKAIASGSPRAMYVLATVYLSGRDAILYTGVALFRMSQEEAERRPDTRPGVKKDTGQALALLRNAADRGDINAMYSLGVLHLNGDVVPVNTEIALSWLEKSASIGNPNAMFVLGEVYRHGQGVDKDEDKGRQWLQKAAGLGNERAKKALAGATR